MIADFAIHWVYYEDPRSKNPRESCDDFGFNLLYQRIDFIGSLI